MHPSTQQHLVSIHTSQLYAEAENARLAAKAGATRRKAAATSHADPAVHASAQGILRRAGAALSAIVPGHRPVPTASAAHVR
jgi:hypothetical protein